MKSALFLVLSSILLVLGLVFVSPVFAQNAQNVSTAAQVNPATITNTNPDVPNNLHTWTQTVMIEVSSALTCQIVGADPTIPNGKCLGIDPNTGKIGFVENGGGAIGILGMTMASMYNIPVHTGDFTAYLADNFGGAKKTYAAITPGNCPIQLGVGFCGLSPLLPIWETFRNVVYLIFVLIFMGIGIAIMLRVHIDPRTVMTIENQIPKLIIGIILVTFSYAIAGFLIDIMYVIIYLFYGVLASIPNVKLESMTPAIMQSTPAIGIGEHLVNGGGILGFSANIAGGIAGLINNMFHLNLDPITISPVGGVLDIINAVSGINGGANWIVLLLDFISAGIAYPIAFQIGDAATGAFKLIPGAELLGAGGVFFVVYTGIQAFVRSLVTFGLPFLIILIATLWALFRLWFSLIQAYVFLMIDVTTAPFWLVFGLLPGGKGFSLWFRDIIANIAVFPTAMIMLMLGDIFIKIFSTCPTGTNACQGIFVPPLIGFTPGTNVLGALLAVGTILSTPEIVKQVRTLLKAPDLNFKSVGQALGKGVGAPQRVVGTGFQMAFGTHYKEGHGLVAESGPLGIGKFARAIGLAH